MSTYVKKKEKSIHKLGLSGKMGGMVLLLSILAYIPIILFGAFQGLRTSKEGLEKYKETLEQRIQNVFEPVVWNYDIETLRMLITTELRDKNLKAVKISSEGSTLIWLTTHDGRVVDAFVDDAGPYIEKRTIPIYRLDDRGRILAYATIWYDHSESRNQFYKSLQDKIFEASIVMTITILCLTISSYFKVVKHLEPIRKSIVEARESSLDAAIKRLESTPFRHAFPEFKVMVSHLKHTLEEIKKLNEGLEAKVAERTIDLEYANCELEAAIEDLRAAQTQLINNEKMAVLGQLVAGIAHEINTPLGIISSAGGTLERILKSEEGQFIEFCSVASEQSINTYNMLIQKGLSDEGRNSSLKRQYRRNFLMASEKNNLDIPDDIIEKLVDLGFEGDENDFISLFSNPQMPDVVRMAYGTAAMHKSVNMIRVSAEKASKVISALKTYSHKQSSQELVHYDVVQDMEVVLTLYYNQTKYGVEITKNYEDVPNVLCYPDKLHQVWVNIINNALQAMEYKGRLNISITRDQEYVRVDITDNGPGIPEVIKDRIFEPFFSTKKLGEGTGLGLDIAKRIVEEIGGRIDFQSQPGKTTFSVWLST